MSEPFKHWGDCSIYMADCDICDCGAFRKAIHAGGVYDEMWEIWAKHLGALDRSTAEVNDE